MKTVKLSIWDAVRRLASIAAAGALGLATVGLATPALAQQHPHNGGGGGPGWSRGPPGAGAPRGGGPNWRGPAGPPRGGGGPGWGRGPGPPPGRAAPAWNRGGPQGGPTWDQRRYNGYWVGGRWYFGAPERPAFETPGFRPGFTPWRRGSFLPPSYQNYVVGEYDRYHLRRPPYGYNWVQVGGEYLLVSASTGLIFDVVTGN